MHGRWRGADLDFEIDRSIITSPISHLRSPSDHHVKWLTCRRRHRRRRRRVWIAIIIIHRVSCLIARHGVVRVRHLRGGVPSCGGRSARGPRSSTRSRHTPRSSRSIATPAAMAWRPRPATTGRRRSSESPPSHRVTAPSGNIFQYIYIYIIYIYIYICIYRHTHLVDGSRNVCEECVDEDVIRCRLRA